MSRAAELFRLQEIDSEIAARKSALGDIEAELADTEELEAAREALTERQETHRELSKKQRDTELDVEGLDSKIEPLEKKLYGGTIGNPKELAALQEDIESIRAHKRTMEDELLDAMSAVEEAQQALDEAQRALAELEERRKADEERLLGEQDRIKTELATLEEERRQQSGLVDAESIRLYESLRSSRGSAVAKVERGTCQGCRITLPMTLLQKVRSGAAIVQCSSCERILYVS
jgi:predicted  nucleic acid-binding Zn-ribbon protein